MNNSEKNTKYNKNNPDEKVAHMNAIFDKYALPIIIFTFAVILIFGVVPKLFSCGAGEKVNNGENASLHESGFYQSRAELLGNAAKSMDAFEKAGYMLIENESTGYVAYKMLDSGVEIMDNLKDSNGNLFSAVTKGFDAQDGAQYETTIMIYSGSLFLVSVTAGEEIKSAIFCDDRFETYTSDSDKAAADVLKIVPREFLTDMMEQYKQSLNEILNV